MANTFDAFFERLTAASGDYNAATVGTLGLLDAVYTDLKPEVARIGQTIRIPFPDIGAFTDQGVSDWTPDSLTPNYVEATIAKRPGKAILIHDFEQFQTSSNLIETFIDPAYKRACEFANAEIAAQLTTVNFTAIPAIASTKPAGLTIDDAANAWDLLVENKVPISGQTDASLIVHNNVHKNMLVDKDWYQENLVGAVIAANARETAAAGSTAFNFKRAYDQQIPTDKTANLTGTVAVTNGSAAVVGTTSKFLTEAPVGSLIFIDGGTVAYRVAAVASDTAMTLAQLYAGTTAGGKNYTRRTYTGVAMHKFAIALAMRPLELVNNAHVTSRLMLIKNVPVRVQISYQHLKSGWLLTMDYGMVAKVIRPSFGVLIKS